MILFKRIALAFLMGAAYSYFTHPFDVPLFLDIPLLLGLGWSTNWIIKE